MVLYTIGYQGLDVPEFIKILQSHQISHIYDVRENPLSRKKGFSKNQLALALTENGIAYEHFRALGTPRELRQEFRKNNDWGWLSAHYLEYLQSRSEEIDRLVSLASDHRCCLMCFEADHKDCHRSLIAEYLQANIAPSIQVRHLSV